MSEKFMGIYQQAYIARHPESVHPDKLTHIVLYEHHEDKNPLHVIEFQAWSDAANLAEKYETMYADEHSENQALRKIVDELMRQMQRMYFSTDMCTTCQDNIAIRASAIASAKSELEKLKPTGGSK